MIQNIKDISRHWAVSILLNFIFIVSLLICYWLYRQEQSLNWQMILPGVVAALSFYYGRIKHRKGRHQLLGYNNQKTGNVNGMSRQQKFLLVILIVLVVIIGVVSDVYFSGTR